MVGLVLWLRAWFTGIGQHAVSRNRAAAHSPEPFPQEYNRTGVTTKKPLV